MALSVTSHAGLPVPPIRSRAVRRPVAVAMAAEAARGFGGLKSRPEIDDSDSEPPFLQYVELCMFVNLHSRHLIAPADRLHPFKTYLRGGHASPLKSLLDVRGVIVSANPQRLQVQ